MSQNIQIPRELWSHINRFHMTFSLYLQTGEEDCLADLAGIHARIYAGLQKKLEASEKRRLYSQYKTATAADVREDSRKAYLDAVGMHKDWRWPEE
jgi:hypothetical protein